ncbi:MAG: hypothetical protein F4087_05575, partial [Gemmatimonadetes bacterium]|nr:hypothetical protein [Gemmatimonadota bacterium]
TLDRASSEATTLTVSAAAVSPATAADFTLSANRTLTVAAGATASTGAVTVTGVDNSETAADKEGTVSATATNAQGITAPSDVTLTIADDEGRHATDITNVQVSNTAAGAVVTWTLPATAPGSVRVQLANNTCATDFGTHTDKSGTATTHTFTGLTSHQTYCVKVTPVTGGEAPVTGNTATQTWTWTNPASDISNLKVTDTLATGSVVTWTLPTTAPANVRVQLLNNTCTTVWGTTDKSGTATTHTFTGLTVGQTYCARVAPVTGGTAGNAATVTWTATALPAATIAAGTSSVTEGTDAEFTVTLSSAAPSGGLTVNLTVEESTNGDYVAAANEGDKTLDFAEGDTSKTYDVATVADMNDEPNGSVTVTLKTGTDYTLGAEQSATVAVQDDDGLTGLAVVGTSGETTKLSVSWDAYGGAEKYVVKWKTGGGSYNTGEESTTTSHEIGGLTAGTSYTVEVSAIDTDTGLDMVLGKAEKSGTTNTPGNSAPAFGSRSYRFSLAENADGSTTAVDVGTVTATDVDTGDTVAYSITGGNSGGKFAIGASTGAITYTGSGEDYESFANPDTAFSLTVRASDGTVHTEVTVTVRVTDVSERSSSRPSFGGELIGNRTYVQGVQIETLQLPAASGGDGSLRYALEPAAPEGLTLDKTARTLSGTPSAPQGAVRYAWIVTDADGDSARLFFTIAVAEPHRAMRRDAAELSLAAVARETMASAVES